MQMIIVSICFLIINFTGHSQTIDGTYKSLELNDLRIDTNGQVYFYRYDLFPGRKFFHEVEIKINGSVITVEKSPVYFDSTKKIHSASDGGFLTYVGTINQNGDVYFAKTQLIYCDYIGMSYFTPPKIMGDYDTAAIGKNHTDLNTLQSAKINLEELEKFKGINGIVFLQKGTINKDFIIRKTKDGLWVNNQLFYQVKMPTLKMASRNSQSLNHKSSWNVPK